MNSESPAWLRELFAGIPGKEVCSIICCALFKEVDLDIPEEPADELRTEFLERSKLSRPQFLRVIDCQASVEGGEILLIDWDIDAACPASAFEENGGSSRVVDEEPDPARGVVGQEPGQPGVNGEEPGVDSGVVSEEPGEEDNGIVGEQPGEEDDELFEETDHDHDGYCAISHTYGMDVYEVFDCGCAAKCKAKVARADPAKIHCKGLHNDSGLQKRVIGDILAMCQLLVQVAGVRYAWHDGVCIAQHDEEEVRHFIRHMGWIYANAESTIIFLHYIGRPMAPIAPGVPPFDDLISRWQTRVWTFQEATLSQRRRYCVRTGPSLRKCSNLREFDDILSSWYEDGGPNSIEVLEEDKFQELVIEMRDVLGELLSLDDDLEDVEESFLALKNKAVKWHICLITWLDVLASSCQTFPTIVHVLDTCSSRESKHEGDRINSILALAGVQNFDAHKDNHVEQSTLHFFNQMGHSGLALALFTTNMYASLQTASNRKHTWFPSLSTKLMITESHTITREPNFHTEDMKFEVLDDGSLEVKGQLVCVAMRFRVVPEGEEAGVAQSIITEELGIINQELVVHLVMSEQLPFYGVFEALAVINKNDQPVQLGAALLRTIEQDSGGEMKSQSRDDNWGMVEQWRHVVPKAAQSVDPERLQNLPVADEVWQTEDVKQILSSGRGADYSHRRMMTVRDPNVQYIDKEHPACHFKAFIIFPAVVLKLDFSDGFSAFLVQGDLHSQVTKIGCFEGEPELLTLLQQHHPYVQACTAFANNLIVR